MSERERVRFHEAGEADALGSAGLAALDVITERDLHHIGCYRDAISNLPEDLRQYSSASEDITRAMLLALAGRRGDTGPPQAAAAAHPARSTVPLRLLALVGAALGLVLALSAVGRVLQRRARERRHLGSAE